ncbi:Uncharacterised protein g6284 [Pycnogonum litorale]
MERKIGASDFNFSNIHVKCILLITFIIHSNAIHGSCNAVSNGSTSMGNMKEPKYCRINKEEPWKDPENVYTCETMESCCFEYGRPSCCITRRISYIAVEQIKLWASIIFFVGVISFVVYYRRSDFSICEGPSVKERLKRFMWQKSDKHNPNIIFGVTK